MSGNPATKRGRKNDTAETTDKVWRAKDCPFEFLKESTKEQLLEIDDKTLEGAKKLLEAEKIAELGQLQAYREEAGWTAAFFDGGLYNKFKETLGAFSVQKLGKLIDRQVMPDVPAEDVLSGKALLSLEDGKVLSKDIARREAYTGSAASFEQPQNISLREGYDIRIVLGASGSGKTMFAINDLATKPIIPPIPATNKKPIPDKSVCFYLTCNALVQHGKNYTSDSLGEKIEKMLKHALVVGSNGIWQDEQGKEPLEMLLTVIIDEAASVGDLLGTIAVLRIIASRMRDLATHVRLIIAGTGYDSISQSICSVSEVMKYRMQPWERRHFRAAATRPASTGLSGTIDGLVDAIIGHPVLSQLTTNPRAALFVLQRTHPFWIRGGKSEHFLLGLIGTVVNLVIEDYIAANGLGGMNADSRRAVAYAVLHELDFMSKSRGIPRFPEFYEVKDEVQKQQAMALIDVHVESRAGKVDFVRGWTRSVSVSPALSMLLFSLLGIEATIYDNWRGFELKTALYAAYKEILTNKETRTNGVRLAQLARPIPEPGATETIRLPLVGDVPTIFVNGEKAPFFDVVSRNAGYHARYSDGDTVTFHVDKAMLKTGTLVDMPPWEQEKLIPKKERKPTNVKPKADSNEKEGESKGSESATTQQESEAEGAPCKDEKEAKTCEKKTERENESKFEKAKGGADKPADKPDSNNEKEGGSTGSENAATKQELEEEGDSGENDGQSSEQEFVPEGLKAFRMGNAAMAGFLYRWANPSDQTTQALADLNVDKIVVGSIAFPLPLPECSEIEDKEEVKLFETVSVDNEKITAFHTFEKEYRVNFVTNAKSMTLRINGGKKEAVVTSSCVDSDGQLMHPMHPPHMMLFGRNSNSRRMSNVDLSLRIPS